MSAGLGECKIFVWMMLDFYSIHYSLFEMTINYNYISDAEAPPAGLENIEEKEAIEDHSDITNSSFINRELLLVHIPNF